MSALALYAFSSWAAAPDFKTCHHDNPELRATLASGTIAYLPDERRDDRNNRICENGYDALRLWSSSFLAPAGPPPKSFGPGGPDGDAYMHDVLNHTAWCGEFSAWSTADGDLSTAWCEGARGTGVGEVLVSPVVDPSKPVELANGLAKSDALFKANGRLKEIRVYVLEEPVDAHFPCPYYGLIEEREGRPPQNTAWKPLLEAGAHAIATAEATLRDTRGYQPLPVPKFTAVKDRQYFVAIEIRSVYPGAKYEDTCVSEIRNPAK